MILGVSCCCVMLHHIVAKLRWLGLVMKKEKRKKKEHTIGPNDTSVHVIWTMDMVEVRGER